MEKRAQGVRSFLWGGGDEKEKDGAWAHTEGNK